MPIPALPLFKHRDTVVTPADQNQFVTQFETTMDTMSNDVIPALNLAITDINGKVIIATTARDEAEDARDIAVAAKDEALTAVATLQEGAIDDTVIAPNKAFSNEYIENNYYDKTETYDKTEVDTAISDATFDINTLTDKPTPIDTDNFALQETGGLLKKLSWANLKATLFDGAMSLTTNGYIKFPSMMGGLIFQWGSIPITSSSISSVIFPLTFTTNCLSIYTSGSGKNNTGVYDGRQDYSCTTNSWTNNGFKIIHSSSFTAPAFQVWLAIGK